MLKEIHAWKPISKRPMGRPKIRWEDDVKNDIHSLVSSLEGRIWQEPEPSMVCYGSGTLHPGQVVWGSLPLLSPAFRRSHFIRQVPPSETMREILAAKDGTVGEKDVR